MANPVYDQALSPRLGQKAPNEATTIRMFTGAELPEAAWTGQIIYRPDEQILQVYNGVAWEDVVGGTSGVYTYVQPDVPVAHAQGDLWFDSDDGNMLYRAAEAGADEVASDAWEPQVLGSQAIASELMGKTITGGLLRTAATGQRVQIRNDTVHGGGIIETYSGVNNETPTIINPSLVQSDTDNAARPALVISTGTGPQVNEIAQFGMISARTGGSAVNLVATNILLRPQNYNAISAVQVGGPNTQITFYGPTQTATGTVTNLTSTNGMITALAAGSAAVGALSAVLLSYTTNTISNPTGYTGTIVSKKFGNMVKCDLNVIRSSGFSNQFTTIATLPTDYRPITQIVGHGCVIFNSTVTYQYLLNTDGTVQLRMSAASPNAMSEQLVFFTS